MRDRILLHLYVNNGATFNSTHSILKVTSLYSDHINSFAQSDKAPRERIVRFL